MNRDDVLNMYRHSRGLSRAAERIAREEGVIKCPTCQQIHAMGTLHPATLTGSGVVVEHRNLNTPKR